jgi:hypothetical protein
MDFNKYFEYIDGKLIWKICKANKIKIGQEVGNIDSEGYRSLMIDGKQYKVHRVIFYMHYGYFPKEVDHINGNRIDNRIENLRGCTRSENMRNKIGTSKTGFKGVYNNHKGFMATIKVNGKKIYLGTFKFAEEASGAYDKAAKQYFGEFAKINNK